MLLRSPTSFRHLPQLEAAEDIGYRFCLIHAIEIKRAGTMPNAESAAQRPFYLSMEKKEGMIVMMLNRIAFFENSRSKTRAIFFR
jgi:hypothetical protein